jgi:PhnB protein
MNSLKVPSGHQAVMPYLMLNDAKKFKTFVLNVFDAKITAEHFQPDAEKIMHCEVDISGSVVMFCDSTENFPPHPANMFVYVENADATYKAAIENGAQSVMEPDDKEYGRSCGVSDPCGNVWWITSIT